MTTIIQFSLCRCRWDDFLHLLLVMLDSIINKGKMLIDVGNALHFLFKF